MSGRLRALAAVSVCVLVVLGLYHDVVYEKLPFAHTGPLAEVAPSESDLSLEPTAAMAASSRSVFREPSLSTFRTSAAPAASTGRPEHHDKELLGAIVAAAMNSTDVSWMSELADRYDIVVNDIVLPQHVQSLTAPSWALFPYTVDDPSPPPELQIPRNKGHEAMVSNTPAEWKADH